ncbi:MAG: DUF1236 domain-containing protein [Bauldia sp.]|nr:DUF1236 domain-containing protein [Bauldia sp.]
MKHLSHAIVLAAGMTLIAAAPAMAIPGYSTAHLNLRSGPGTQYPVVGLIEYNAAADITGCIADWTWCSVNVGGASGWVSAEYLVIDNGGQVQQIDGPDSGIPVVEAEGVAEVIAPATVGVVVGAKGKVEAIVPEPAVLEYIAATPVDPYAVEGEIVVGAVLPEQVTLYEVPGSPYGYTIVNGNKVLVDVTSRAVVYIYRA